MAELKAAAQVEAAKAACNASEPASFLGPDGTQYFGKTKKDLLAPKLEEVDADTRKRQRAADKPLPDAPPPTPRGHRLVQDGDIQQAYEKSMDNQTPK